MGDAGCEFEQTIVKTDYPSLFVLPAGNKNAEATEILRSERMASLLASLAADPRRIVLIDAPPLLVTSEAGVVTSLAGQVVIVVKAAETPQEAVARAVETIAEDKPVSLVLNQADAVQVHGYGYYGRYSYGRPDDASGNSVDRSHADATPPITSHLSRLRAATGVALALDRAGVAGFRKCGGQPVGRIHGRLHEQSAAAVRRQR